MTESQKFETWAVVEVMGHSRYAGFVTEQAVGGCAFVRVDVPEVPATRGNDKIPTWQWHDGFQAFTKLLGQGSIFGITPCTEEVAREAASQFRSAPLTCVEMPQVRRIAQTVPDDDDEELDGDDNPDTFM